MNVSQLQFGANINFKVTKVHKVLALDTMHGVSQNKTLYSNCSCWSVLQSMLSCQCFSICFRPSTLVISQSSDKIVHYRGSLMQSMYRFLTIHNILHLVSQPVSQSFYRPFCSDYIAHSFRIALNAFRLSVFFSERVFFGWLFLLFRVLSINPMVMHHHHTHEQTIVI